MSGLPASSTQRADGVGFVPLKTPPGVLGEIVARKRQDLPPILAKAAKTRGLRPFAPSVPDPTVRWKAFADGLRGGRHGAPRLIAEVKPRSPSRGVLVGDGSIPAMLAQAERYRGHASVVSVLCDGPYFGGSLDLFRAVADALDCPVLCKDFVISRGQIGAAAEAGAGAVLLMASLLPRASLRELLTLAREHDLGALVEVHDEAELADAIAVGADVIGVNSRDLTTLKIELDRAIDLLKSVPSDRVVIAESGIETAADIERVKALVDGVLIGTTLMLAADVDRTIRALKVGRQA